MTQAEPRKSVPRALVWLAGVVLLLACSVFAMGIGPMALSPAQVVAALGSPAGDAASSVVWSIRLPRVLLGVLVGGGLAIAGAALQGLFRNPLADPGLIGVSSGAALGATAGILLGTFAWAVPGAAFLGGLAATLAVLAIGRRQGRVNVAAMLLSGIAINSVCGALVGLLIFTADDRELRTVTFWTMGSLGHATWPMLTLAAPLILLSVAGLLFQSKALNALLLGDASARHLGVPVERVSRIVVLLASACVGAAVAASGIIGFVGLVVPHLIRLTFGPDHRHVLPLSVLLGGSLLVLADALARIVVAPAELPLGILTAVIGTPVFILLLIRGRQKYGF
jgi:iron complex transport system permease protein